MFEKEEMLSSEKNFNERITYASEHIGNLTDIEIRHLYEEIIKDKMIKTIMKKAKYVKRIASHLVKQEKEKELRSEIAKIRKKIYKEN